MLYNEILTKYRFEPQRAVEFGFTEADGVFFLRRPLKDKGFFAEIEIESGRFEINVFEAEDGEPYLPFNATADNGGFVSTIRAYAQELADEVVQNCFAVSDVKTLLLDYVKEAYGTEPEAPWGYLKEYHTLNTARRHKWYGLFMLIPYRYLGVDSDGKVHVLNVKAKPDDIPQIIDHVHYFPSYHMNKKYWISILLDSTADVEEIKSLLDNSYAIVEK